MSLLSSLAQDFSAYWHPPSQIVSQILHTPGAAEVGREAPNPKALPAFSSHFLAKRRANKCIFTGRMHGIARASVWAQNPGFLKGTLNLAGAPLPDRHPRHCDYLTLLEDPSRGGGDPNLRGRKPLQTLPNQSTVLVFLSPKHPVAWQRRGAGAMPPWSRLSTCHPCLGADAYMEPCSTSGPAAP